MVALPTLLLTLAVSAGGDTVLLDFYSDSCGPCRMMTPVIQQFVSRGYPVRQVNVTREPALASRFGVTAIPCFVMLVDGREVDRAISVQPAARLEQMFALARTKNASPPVHMVSTDRGRDGRIAIPAVRSGPAFGDATQQDSAAVADLPRSAAVLGWRQAPADWGPAQESTAISQADLIAATVRLRIEDASGHSVGSGTIIDARKKEALVLTCGHLFRDSQGKGRIEVDLFGPHPVEKAPGTLIHYDLERDVALVSISTSVPVSAARVAPPGYQVQKGMKVFTAGCNGGDVPTVRQAVVTGLDKFLGPPNIQVAGLPVQGRSGGGLFTADGSVIGVCNAAVPTDNEGLFAALGSIHSELERAQLGFICRGAGEKERAAGNVAASDPPAMPQKMPPPGDVRNETVLPQPAAPAGPAAGANTSTQRLSQEEQAALDEIQRRKAEGAEVICVIRPRSNPQGQSEIIVLDKASPAFLQQLSAGSTRAARPNPANAPEWTPRWLQPGYRGE